MPGEKASSSTRPSSRRSILGVPVGRGRGLRAGGRSGGGGPYGIPGGAVRGGAAPSPGGVAFDGGPQAWPQPGPQVGGWAGVRGQGCWPGGVCGSVGSATELLADVGNPSLAQAAEFTVV
jgi:hypothetical protein